MRYKKKMNCIAACKRRLVFVLLIVIFIVFLLLWPHYWIINDIDRKLRLENIDLLIKKEASNLTCKQPVLDVYNPEIMKFVRKVAPIDCSKASIDWVKCTGSECVIQEDAKRKFGPIKCAFTDIIRINDFELSDGKTTSSSEYYKLEKSDVVRANCQSADRKWSATLTGLRLDNNIWDRSNWEEMNRSALKMNVLMFGYDSLSRNAFIRKLPKTYKYLTNELGAIVLQGYNIIGDGTPQALIPILTGKTELELPDTRKRLRNTHFVNSYPFIWEDYKRAGYVTAFLEDLPSVGTFTYRLNGFKEVPTDHYMRPYYLANLGEQSKWPKLCTGNIPRHQVMLNMIKDFFSMYQTKPKFLFGFHGELSHDDYNLIGAADDDTLDLITDLHDSGALNNTILIIMADHGHRFADVRDTIQGKQEERLPFFSFTFPKWFKQKYPRAYDNFQSNANKLTTPFDIHKTLMDVLHLHDTGTADIVNNRAVSLFSKIPLERSCAHAYIEPHWCTCLDWENMSIENPVTYLVMRIRDTLVDKINEITESHRRICEKLSVKQVHWIMKMSPNKDLLKFSHNADIDGFVADLSAKLQVDSDLYQIKATLVPGDSIFEASLRHFRDSDKMVLKISDISRINMYKSQAWCVEENLPHLGKYCYCKK